MCMYQVGSTSQRRIDGSVQPYLQPSQETPEAAKEVETNHHHRPNARRSLLCPARPCVAHLVRSAPIPVSGHGSLQRAAPPPPEPRLQQRLPGREVAETVAHAQEMLRVLSTVYQAARLDPLAMARRYSPLGAGESLCGFFLPLLGEGCY